MCPTMKHLLFSLLLAGLTLASPTNERSKRYAQVPEEPQRPGVPNIGTNPLIGLVNGIRTHIGEIRNRLENGNSSITGRTPLRDLLSRIGQQRNGSQFLDNIMRRIHENWDRRFSRANTTIPARNIQLLRELFQVRNSSQADVRARIDGLLARLFTDLSDRLSNSNITLSSRNIQELRELVRQRIETRNQRLQRLQERIRSFLNQRYPVTPSTSGSVGGSASATSGEGSISTSGSGSGSAESGGSSGGISSGSGESGGSS